LRKFAGRALEQQREALARLLEQYADHSRRKVTVVFDGYAAKRKPDASAPPQGVEIIFSETGKTADDVIERLVAEADERGRILVVSSDNMVRQTVESLGAHSVAAEMFGAELEGELRELARLVRAHGRRRRLGSGLDKFQP
jgi:predicted RNA-binding protein with PIN domain